MRQRRLYLLFTRAQCRAVPGATLRAALAGGVDVVQFREKQLDASARAWLAELLAICRAHHVPVLVNDDVALASASGADGAHVGQDDLPAARARALLGHGRILGVSTHDLEQVHRAQADGADYIGIGPCYPTTTKGYAAGLGATAIGALARAATLPAFAIGGITPERVPELVRHGVRRIAVAGAILAAPDPQAAAQALAAALPPLVSDGPAPAAR